MRVLLLLGMVMLLAACGAYSLPGSASPSPSTGVVSGRVLAYPCAPIEQPGTMCAGRPVPGLELDYTGQACAPCKTVTDSRGDYSMVLDAGTYKVRPVTYMRVISGPLAVRVAAGAAVVANYLLDSGIRAPVPQA